MTNSNNEDFELLLEAARAAFGSMTPAQKVHHRHEQRICFAAGNMDHDTLGEIGLEKAIELARAAAGPCPCGECSDKGMAARNS